MGQGKTFSRALSGRRRLTPPLSEIEFDQRLRAALEVANFHALELPLAFDFFELGGIEPFENFVVRVVGVGMNNSVRRFAGDPADDTGVAVGSRFWVCACEDQTEPASA